MKKVQATTKPKVKNPRKKRGGPITKVERALVKAVILDQPKEMDTRQIQALAQATRRSTGTIKSIIREARENLGASAKEYVDIHMQATQGALAEGEFDTAQKGAQWALTHLSGEGERVIEKETTMPVAPRIVLGISLGGVNMKQMGDSPSIQIVEGDVVAVE